MVQVKAALLKEYLQTKVKGFLAAKVALAVQVKQGSVKVASVARDKAGKAKDGVFQAKVREVRDKVGKVKQALEVRLKAGADKDSTVDSDQHDSVKLVGPANQAFDVPVKAAWVKVASVARDKPDMAKDGAFQAKDKVDLVLKVDLVAKEASVVMDKVDKVKEALMPRDKDGEYQVRTKAHKAAKVKGLMVKMGKVKDGESQDRVKVDLQTKAKAGLSLRVSQGLVLKPDSEGKVPAMVQEVNVDSKIKAEMQQG